MADEQNRLTLSPASKTNDKILFVVARSGKVDILFIKASHAQALGHRFGSRGHITNRIGGIDFDELLQNFARELLNSFLFLPAHGSHDTQHQGQSYGKLRY